MSTRHINPEGLHRSPAFSQAVVVEQPTKTIYIGGQNGVDADGKVVAGLAPGSSSRSTPSPSCDARGRGYSGGGTIHRSPGWPGFDAGCDPTATTR
jgi:hypothetical protein